MYQQVQHLSNLDLLAILVGSNQAECLLLETGGGVSALFAGEPGQLPVVREPGASYGNWAAPRVMLQAARELVRRSLAENLAERPCLGSPREAREFLALTLRDLQHEVFIALCLDAQQRVISVDELFRGTLSQTSVYPREIVKLALARNAGAVIFAHNHPSGMTEPSTADLTLTGALKQALALVDVRVVDHFIVGGNKTLSFAERGLL